eukprot:10896110-Alexandrium_andersonii.AAC.1
MLKVSTGSCVAMVQQPGSFIMRVLPEMREAVREVAKIRITSEGLQAALDENWARKQEAKEVESASYAEVAQEMRAAA